MEELSFFEKLAVLGSNILAHPIFILLLLSPALIFALNKKITKKIIIAIYIVIIAIVLFVGNTTLFALLDNVIDGLFMSIYFPNFITLFVVVVASAIIALITFTKKNMLKVNKVINIVGFAIVQTIFCLILTVVQVNKIDIYKENALYTNNDVLTLMQLLMGTFVLQILAVLIFNAIEKVTEMLDNKDERVRQYRNLEKAKGLTNVDAEDLFGEEEKIIIPEEKIAPLDRSLIEEEKITPISLIDAINKEQDEKVSSVDIPVIDNKPKFVSSKLDAPDIFGSSPVIEPKKPIEELLMPEPVKAEPSIDKPVEIIPEIPVMEPVKPIVQVEPVVPVVTKQEQQPEEELITNLVIVNLTKTVLAIKNIKRLYTM